MASSAVGGARGAASAASGPRLLLPRLSPLPSAAALHSSGGRRRAARAPEDRPATCQARGVSALGLARLGGGTRESCGPRRRWPVAGEVPQKLCPRPSGARSRRQFRQIIRTRREADRQLLAARRRRRGILLCARLCFVGEALRDDPLRHSQEHLASIAEELIGLCRGSSQLSLRTASESSSGKAPKLVPRSCISALPEDAFVAAPFVFRPRETRSFAFPPPCLASAGRPIIRLACASAGLYRESPAAPGTARSRADACGR